MNPTSELTDANFLAQLQLPAFHEDWGIEHADFHRLAEFISKYEEFSLTEQQRFFFYELILQSANDGLRDHELTPEILAALQKFLREHVNDVPWQRDYWSRLKEEDFPVAQFVQEARQLAIWNGLRMTKDGLLQVEKETNENGFYAQYRGIARDALFKSVSQSLVAAGYIKTATAFDGNVLGYTKNEEQLAVKIDGGDVLYLAIFNEKGKEPMLHGVVFGKYGTGPTISGDEAKKALFKELEAHGFHLTDDKIP